MTQECGSVLLQPKSQIWGNEENSGQPKVESVKFSCGEPGEAPHCDEPATNAASGPPPPLLLLLLLLPLLLLLLMLL